MDTKAPARPSRQTAICLTALCLLALPGHTEQVQGAWWTALTTPSGPLTLILDFSSEDSGTLAVPSRGLEGIPLTGVELHPDGTLAFSVRLDGSTFRGKLSGDRIAGQWTQAGISVPTVLLRGQPEQVEVLTRPQTPKAPFPYLVEEVRVQSAVHLSCTVTRPENEEPKAGVVLLTVAGINDRDQTHSGHKPYWVLADFLTRLGLAVIRCDDRGFGQSQGSLFETTISELAEDAIAMADHLRKLGVHSTGMIGNSEGSVVASAAAAEQPDQVAFVVVLGGVGVDGASLIRARLIGDAKSSGESARSLDQLAAPFDKLVKITRQAEGVGLARLKTERKDLYNAFVEVAEAGSNDPTLPASVMERAELFAGPWYHSQITLHGGKLLERVKVPVLALTGSKDKTNLPDQNLPAIRAALERGNNTDYEVQKMPDLNHVFQTANVGGMREYGTLEESFSPIALEHIGQWILKRVSRGAN